jgi:hypothetical protein
MGFQESGDFVAESREVLENLLSLVVGGHLGEALAQAVEPGL